MQTQRTWQIATIVLVVIVVILGGIILSQRGISLNTQNQLGNQEQGDERAQETEDVPSGAQIISVEQLQNATYSSLHAGNIQLRDGSYRGMTAGENVPLVLLGNPAFGDLNEDGKQDAVVILSTSYGAGAEYEIAVMINANGIPEYVAGEKFPYELSATGVSIVDGEINVQLKPRPGAPDLVPVKRVYRLTGGSLQEMYSISGCGSGTNLPVITSLSRYSGPIGTKIEIHGCNFSGFEGDLNAWIENNNQGVRGILYGEAGSTSKLIKVTLTSPLCQKDNSYSGLPCDAWLTLTPGVYEIYTTPLGEKSNELTFTVEQ